MTAAQINAPVTYNPVTPEWAKDVRQILDPHFGRHTKWFLETGQPTSDDLKVSASDPESTTRNLTLMKIAFYSGWRERRREASDILTAELWLRYWVKLQRRSEYCINPK
jgi:hypothetical protein